MKITLLDYGAGNVTSVERALRKLDAEPQRSNAPKCIASAEAIILPGVGHYSALIRALDQQNLRAPLLDSIRRGVPFLGICLGLQALYASSEEASDLAGLEPSLWLCKFPSLPPSNFLTWAGINCTALVHLACSKASRPTHIFTSLTPSPPRTPMAKPWLLAITARISPRSSKKKTFSPSNSTPRRAATQEHNFFETSWQVATDAESA